MDLHDIANHHGIPIWPTLRAIEDELAFHILLTLEVPTLVTAGNEVQDFLYFFKAHVTGS